MSSTIRPGQHRLLTYLDRSGAAMSTLCALHCALMPIVVAVLPLIGLTVLAEEGTETGLIILSSVLGLASLGLGYRVHRSWWVLAVLVVGFTLLAAGRWVGETKLAAAEVALTVGGGLMIAGSHLLSRRLCSKHCTSTAWQSRNLG